MSEIKVVPCGCNDECQKWRILKDGKTVRFCGTEAEALAKKAELEAGTFGKCGCHDVIPCEKHRVKTRPPAPRHFPEPNLPATENNMTQSEFNLPDSTPYYPVEQAAPPRPQHFVPASCQGEKCRCGQSATHKVEEFQFHDDTRQRWHPLTAYVCCEHFKMVMGRCEPLWPNAPAAPAAIEQAARPLQIPDELPKRTIPSREEYSPTMMTTEEGKNSAAIEQARPQPPDTPEPNPDWWMCDECGAETADTNYHYWATKHEKYTRHQPLIPPAAAEPAPERTPLRKWLQEKVDAVEKLMASDDSHTAHYYSGQFNVLSQIIYKLDEGQLK